MMLISQIQARNGDANSPALRYDAINSEWTYSNDGITFNSFNSGGTNTAYGYYTLSADQSTNLSAGNKVAFNTETYISSDAEFSFDSANKRIRSNRWQ